MSMRLLFSGDWPVAYGQFYVTGDEGPIGDMSATFAGQTNGLCGARCAGELFFVTGLHSGTVPVAVEAHEGEPDLDGGWEDVVEVSFTAASFVQLSAWGGAAAHHLDLSPGSYRVRYCACGMDAGRFADTRMDDDGDLDRYLVQFWPAPAAADRVLRQSSDTAAYWHGVARAVPPPTTVPKEPEGGFRHPPTVEMLLRVVGTDPATVAPRPELTGTTPRRVPSDLRVGRLPPGAGPKAGYAGADGTLVVFGDGTARIVHAGSVTLVFRAYETALGTLLTGLGQPALLVDPNGGQRVIGSEYLNHFLVVDRDGRRVAVTESRRLRHGSWWRPAIIDLADGIVHPLAWDEHRSIGILAFGDEVLFANTQPNDPDRRGAGGTVRWPLGGTPQPVGANLLQVDPWSGTSLAEDPSTRQLVVTDADGNVLGAVDAEMSPRLVPGGRHVYRFDYSTPALRVLDLATEQWRTYNLPFGAQISDSTPGRHVWEDPRHLVVLVEGYRDQGDAVRLDIETGELNVLRFGHDPGYRPILTEPLATSRR
jgi:hypothetical protein